MSVAVIVPTCDRPAALDRCLAALADQSQGDLEVIVVDDGRRLPARVPRPIRLVQGSRCGPAAARNAGISAADAEIVLLLDDDCVPDPGWAEALGRRAAEGVLVGGSVVTGGADAFVMASETIAHHVERATGLVRTCNAGLPREVALAIPFDERFPAAAAEDRDWCARLVAAGVRIVREPGARVRHLAEPGAVAFGRQHLRYGRAAARHGRTAAGGGSFYRELVHAGFREGLLTGALVLAAQVVTATGYALETMRSVGPSRVGG